MRFYGIAILTLAVLLSGNLSAQAEEQPIAEDANTSAITPEDSVTVPTVSETKVELAVTPESDNIPETSRFQRSVPSEAVTDVPGSLVRVGAEATKQATVAATSETSISSQYKSNTKDLKDTKEVLEITEIPTTSNSLPSPILSSDRTPISQPIAEAKPQAKQTCIAQASGVLAQGTARCPRPEPIQRVVVPKLPEESGASPALSIYIPVGYGADNGTIFLNGNYQPTVREDDGSVGAGGIGIGLGDASKAVGLELSYALATRENFGEGGFNAKLHKRFGTDLAGALGWNGFVNIGRNDFEHSKYGVITKVIRTQQSLNSPFSRVALTVGVGDGQFRSNGAVDAGENNVNVFGNVAIRVIRPVSFIAEWTGQDLALGLSIAPFKNFPFVITPAFRDVAGAGDGARFVIGAGTALRF